MRLCSSLPLLLFPCFCLAQKGLDYSRIFPLIGNAQDSAITAMATDSAGNVYLTGWTEELGLPTTPGVIQPTPGVGECTNGGAPSICPDAFVIKLDAHGKLVFATYLGGPRLNQASSIGLDAAGNIYVAGVAAQFPELPGSKFSGGATFIAKLNPSATRLLYTASIPGTGIVPLITPFGPNTPTAIINMTVDSAGNAYFAATGTSGFPITSNAVETAGGIAAGKLDPTGQKLLYATYLSGSPGGVTIDSAGNLYITGGASSGAALIAKLNPSGALDYATYLGGKASAFGQVIRVDSSGNAYILGLVGSTQFPVTPGAYQSAYVPGAAFLAKVNADATSLVYATFVSTNSVPPSLLDVDAAGNAYVSGQAAQGFVASPDALQSCRAGGADAFVLQLSPEGKYVASTYLGGSAEDFAYAVKAEPDGTVLLAGATTTSDFLTSPDTPFEPPGYFVAKLNITDLANATLPCSILAPENAANFFDEGPVAPGELVTLWGNHFGPEIGAHEQVDSSGKIATELAGVRVFFDQFEAPLLYASSKQINAQVPWELNGQSSAQFRVEYNGISTRTGIVQIVPSSPALFHTILNQDGTVNSPANPAGNGSIVSVYGTGGGSTNPESVTGGNAPFKPLAKLVLPVSILIDEGFLATVHYAGVAPGQIDGTFLIQFHVPPILAPSTAHRVDVQIGSGATLGMITVTMATK